jgi:hypothetical protein
VELEATREALEEEGAARAQALQGELEGLKGELGRAQVNEKLFVGCVLLLTGQSHGYVYVCLPSAHLRPSF